jgi:hypothetical protein
MKVKAFRGGKAALINLNNVGSITRPELEVISYLSSLGVFVHFSQDKRLLDSI